MPATTDRPPDAAPYDRITEAISYLRAHQRRQPDLASLAGHIGLSESQTQRLFSRWAGISPKRFVQFLTVEYAKRRMTETADLLNLSFDAGLSGPGRLHDLFVNMEAMSPGEYKRAAQGLTIQYGRGDSPFGTALIAFTERGICHLAFDDDGRTALTELAAAWPNAALERDDRAAHALLVRVFERARNAADGLSLWVVGTNFQIQVWRALLRVPFAGLLSYGQLANALGRPRAARSVGTAIARNPVGYLIPCHRVLRDSGEFGDYHWGTARKAAICAWEAARDAQPAADDGRSSPGPASR